jgi:glyceraldehyde-3-phosphate dehydrogenase/erythrose-4-phosphate dehydrogenase
MMAGPATGGAAGDAGGAEEKTAWDVVLKSGGEQKIQVIKVIREATGLGLKEAKDIVDGAPKAVKTGLAKADAEELKGKIDGVSIRVPTPNVSLVDFVANLKTDATKESVNQALTDASSGPLKGVMAAEKAELVSIDYNGSPYSSTIDLASTQAIGSRMVKVLAWYDNESGFSHRMVDLALLMTEKGL